MSKHGVFPSRLFKLLQILTLEQLSRFLIDQLSFFTLSNSGFPSGPPTSRSPSGPG